jgi:hypothetical protein
MEILRHGFPSVKSVLITALPCTCRDADFCPACADRHAAELAARLGLTPASQMEDDVPDGITLHHPALTADQIIAAGESGDPVLLPPLDEDTAPQDGQDGPVGPRDFFDDCPADDYDACDITAMLADCCPVWDARRGGWIDDDEDGPEDHQTADPAINWANVENALEAIHATLMDAACEIAFQQGWSLGYRGLPVVPLRGVTTAERQAFEDGLRAGDRERREDEDVAAALAERYTKIDPEQAWVEGEIVAAWGHRAGR